MRRIFFNPVFDPLIVGLKPNLVNEIPAITFTRVRNINDCLIKEKLLTDLIFETLNPDERATFLEKYSKVVKYESFDLD